MDGRDGYRSDSKGKFGVRIEDIVVVTQAGVWTLTEFDHKLVVKG